jgi:hypothetical protein
VRSSTAFPILRGRYLSALQYTTAAAAQDIATFIAILSNGFSEFGAKPFHIAGESYGVRPSVALRNSTIRADGGTRRGVTSRGLPPRCTTSMRTSASTT